MSLRPLALLLTLLLLATPAAAADIAFTVTMSEPVIVSTAPGTPSIAIDVGGQPRAATYRSGSGTSTLTFAYSVQPGDFDPDGIALTPSITAPAGSITDLAGNPLSNYGFTPPATTGLKVQTYRVAFQATPITSANAGSVSFTISGAPPNSTGYDYAITSSNGGTAVTGSGTMSGSSVTVSNVDVSGLAMGTLSLAVTVTAPAGTGLPKVVTATPSFTSRPLDGVAGVAAAYSLRQLRSSYGGPLIAVRKSGVAGTKDIWPTLMGDLAVSELMSHCSGATCSIAAWYDQSTNGNNASQSTAGAQPDIVTGGVMQQLSNGKPALNGKGSSEMTFALPASLLSYPITVNLVVKKNAALQRGCWLKLGGVAAYNGGIALCVGGYNSFDPPATGGGETIWGLKEWVEWISTGTALAPSAVVTFMQAAGANGSSIFQNGAALTLYTSGSAPQTPDSGTPGYLFGHVYFTGQTRYTQDSIAEMVILSSLLSTAARQSLEREQGGYFGITVQ